MKKNFKTVLLLLFGVDLLVLGLAVFLLARGRGALAPAASSEKPDLPEETFSTIVIPGQDGEANQAALLLSQMSLEEKVGQLFIIRPDSLVPAQTQEQINEASAAGITCLTEAMADSLRKYSVGGVIFFGKNITDPQQITDFIAALQENSATPLFIAVDEEGGAVSRLASHPNFDLPKYESAAAVGASGDPAQALEMGNTIGAYLKQYGFNMDFAPDADVNTNPQNPIIGERAFSSDANVAAEMAAAMAEGLRQNGVIPVFKHFPGHGDTAEDSHNSCAISYKTAEEMAGCEWLPFMGAAETDGVMVGHIAAPNVTGDMTPASLSHTMVTEILKEQLGFQGLVITDSLAMNAVTEDLSPGEAAVRAIEAGCDMILMPNGLSEAYQGILDAVAEGRLSEARIDESAAKILEVKIACGIIK